MGRGRRIINSIRRRGKASKIRMPIDPNVVPEIPSENQIETDMKARQAEGTIMFDLGDDKWMKDPESFWAEFKHTGQILVPKDFRKWLIGQEEMVEELMLNLEEWVRKLKD